MHSISPGSAIHTTAGVTGNAARCQNGSALLCLPEDVVMLIAEQLEGPSPALLPCLT